MTDCAKCQASQPKLTRQALGCGYEPPLVELHGRPFKPMPWQPHEYSGDAPTMCAGYTTALPEVIEASRARLHWEKGDVRSFLLGEQPTEQLITAVEVLEIEVLRVRDVIQNRKKE